MCFSSGADYEQDQKAMCNYLVPLEEGGLGGLICNALIICVLINKSS